MASLESPGEPGDLYRYRGLVPATRPVLQGDIFDAVDLPGFGSPQRVAIVTHPCTMRREGAELRDRLVVALVAQADQPLPLPWRGHFRVMPLPDLDPGGASWQVEFDEIHTVPSALLPTDKRITSLEDRGILLLQQRYIHHLTRYVVETPALHESCIHVLTEADLMEEWSEALLTDRAGADSEEQIREVQREFDDFISQYREQLKDPTSRATVRRQTFLEIRNRL